MTDEMYAKLSAPFDQIHTDVRGGVALSYITGEQVVSRLNDSLGVTGWDFRTLEHGIHESDEVWVLGELVCRIEGTTITRQQFGSQKIRRSRATGMPLDLGFDLKGAATDSMKKCASLIGVGLYLSKKENAPQQRRAAPPAQQPQRPPRQIEERPAPIIHCQAVVAQPNGQPQTCGEILSAVDDSGLLWSAIDLANNSTTKFKRPFCWKHYQQAITATAKAG